MSDKDRQRETRKRAASVKAANAEQLTRSAAHFREELRRFCEEQGGQNEAAPLLGTTQATISRWLAAQKPTHPKLWMMVALSRATGRTVDALLGLARVDGATSVSALDRLTLAVDNLTAARDRAEKRAEIAEAALRRQSSHVREKTRA